MDLTLTEDQKMLKSTVQELLRRDLTKDVLTGMDARQDLLRRGIAGRDGAGVEEWDGLWPRLASTGLLGSLIPEEYGGVGGSLMDTAIIYEELGRGPVPGPHFSSGVLAALALLEGGTEAQKRALLPGIAQGTVRVALAVTEPDYGWGPEYVQARAVRRDGGLVLDGTKLHVLDATQATHLLVAVRVDDATLGLALVEAGAPGVSVRLLTGLATGSCEVKLEGVDVPDSALLGGGAEDGWAVLERVFVRALPVLAAYQVGGLDRVFQMSLEYSRTRHQFQQPIGRFQRVQDHVIDIVNHLDAARWATYEALWKLDTGKPDAAAGAHMAAVLAKEGYYLGCNSAHDVHAGVGIMREYGLTLHTKMSRTLYHYLGSPRYHRRRLAQALAL